VSRVRFLAVALVAAVGVLALPDTVHACAMCFSGSEESRKAFFVTAAFLTLLPLGMVAGATAWLRGKARRVEAEESATGPTDTTSS
jgi:hypothetical protein